MTTKQKNLKKKLASLSALGVGVVVAGAEKAEAAVIYYPNINADVGFGIGAAIDYLSPMLGTSTAAFAFYRVSSHAISTSYNKHVRGILAIGCGCLNFATNGVHTLQVVQAGALWTQLMQGSHIALVGARIWGALSSRSSGSHSSGGSGPLLPFAYQYGLSSFSNKYALFTFESGPNTLYGWIHLSYTVTSSFGGDSGFGPTLTIHDFAYDDSGQPLAAGVTPTPEPSTIASTGLAALVLGAAGLRRWRKARPAA